MVRALFTLVAVVLRSALALFRSREDQAIVELALRQQLAVYIHKHPRPRLSPLDRGFQTPEEFFPDSMESVSARARHPTPRTRA